MIEAEAAFMTNIEDVAAEAELLVKAMTRSMLEKGAADMQSIGASEPHWLDTNFGVMSYEDAIQVLEKNSDRVAVPVTRGTAFAKEHELFLVQHNNGVPIFVIDWPKEIKPFYMKECESDESKVNLATSRCQCLIFIFELIFVILLFFIFLLLLFFCSTKLLSRSRQWIFWRP